MTRDQAQPAITGPRPLPFKGWIDPAPEEPSLGWDLAVQTVQDILLRYGGGDWEIADAVCRALLREGLLPAEDAS